MKPPVNGVHGSGRIARACSAGGGAAVGSSPQGSRLLPPANRVLHNRRTVLPRPASRRVQGSRPGTTRPVSIAHKPHRAPAARHSPTKEHRMVGSGRLGHAPTSCISRQTDTRIGIESQDRSAGRRVTPSGRTTTELSGGTSRVNSLVQDVGCREHSYQRYCDWPRAPARVVPWSITCAGGRTSTPRTQEDEHCFSLLPPRVTHTFAACSSTLVLMSHAGTPTGSTPFRRPSGTDRKKPKLYFGPPFRQPARSPPTQPRLPIPPMRKISILRTGRNCLNLSHRQTMRRFVRTLADCRTGFPDMRRSILPTTGPMSTSICRMAHSDTGWIGPPGSTRFGTSCLSGYPWAS